MRAVAPAATAFFALVLNEQLPRSSMTPRSINVPPLPGKENGRQPSLGSASETCHVAEYLQGEDADHPLRPAAGALREDNKSNERGVESALQTQGVVGFGPDRPADPPKGPLRQVRDRELPPELGRLHLEFDLLAIG